MPELKDEIINRLKTLSVIPEVKIKVTDSKRTIKVQCNTVFSLDFRFKCNNDHYIGYAVDAEEERTHAVVSLWSASEASHFVMAYIILIELCANR